MSETAMKFGPEWLRALSHGNSAPSPVSFEAPPLPKYKLAQYRYGREEMLALFAKDLKIPEELTEFDYLVTEKCQLPLALLPVTEDEQRIWSRSVNSDVALRASGKSTAGPGNGIIRGGSRGGSVDRGRGRGRGGYYQRGVTFEENEDAPPGNFPRLRTLERSQSANEKDQRWDERDRRFERPFASRSGVLDDSNNSSSLGKQESLRPPSDNWRRSDDDGGWRTAGTRTMDKYVGRNTWRNSNDRDRMRIDFDNKDKNHSMQNGPGKNVSQQPRQRSNSGHFWDDTPGDNLPEWSVEESTVTEVVGSFDSSGAFLETKMTDTTCNSNDIYTSDDEDCVKKKDSPKVKPTAKPKVEPEKEPPRGKSSSELKISHSSIKEENKTFDKSYVQSSSKTIVVDKKNEPLRVPQTNVVPQTVIKPNNGVRHEPCAMVKEVPAKPMAPEAPVHTEESQGPTEEDAFAHHKKATENMMARWTEEEEQRVTTKSAENATILPSHPDDVQKWFYQDPQSDIQGPFTSAEMRDWFNAGYFAMDLLVRRGCDDRFTQLGELIQLWGCTPFSPGTNRPPLRAVPVKQPASITPPITQPATPAAMPSTQPATPLVQSDAQLRLMQQQIFQQFLQQQLLIRQAHMEQVLNHLKQQESFAKLNPQQQTQAVAQILAQQIPRPTVGPLPEQPVLEAVPGVPFPMMGLGVPPVVKGDVPMWNGPSSTGTWPLTQSIPQPPTGSIWDTDSPMPIEVSDLEKKLAAEEDEKRRIEAVKKLEEEKRREEEERRKKEEAERLLKELQRKKEEEIRRLEELKRLKEEQRREEMKRQKEEEQRLEEMKRLKEEEQKLEELRQLELRKAEELRKEELRKQEERKLEEERKRRESERLKQLEEQRLEELRQQEIQKEQERLKKQQEEAERVKEQQAAELKMQKEAERQKEYEKQQLLQKREAEKQFELQQRKEAENNQRIIEAKGPVWGLTNNDWPSGDLSLASIQKLQEKNDKEEKEMIKQQQLQQQKLIMQQQSIKQAQSNKNGLSWAKRSAEPSNSVKSLTEIQKEEAQRLAQQQQKIQKITAATVTEATGVWGNSSQLNRITSAPGWNSSNSGFWEDPVKSVPVQQAYPTKNSDSAFPALGNSAKPANVNSNKNKVRAKRDEDAVLKIFEAHRKPTDEFTAWCTEALSNLPSSVDVPTFVAFLKDVESPFEVSDYVKSYLGEGKEAHEFGKQFLERRSKFRNQAKKALVEENMWGPAPAITPSVKTVTINDSDTNNCTKGKAKKKRNKMHKLDSSMLGFTVQSNPDRINVGEIDRVEGM